MRDTKTPFEEFVIKSINEDMHIHRSHIVIPDGKSSEYTIEDFRKYFNHNYAYIQHSLSDEDIKQFMKGRNFRNLMQAADHFQDYLLSQDLSDGVQE